MKRLLAAALVAAAATARAQGADVRKFPLDGIKEIRAQAGSGAIEVEAGPELAVEVTENAKPDLCRITMEANGGALVLRAEEAKMWFVAHEGCRAGFRVTAPAGLALDIKAGSGNVRLAGRAGAASVTTGSGKITGTASGPLSIKSGSGGAELSGLASTASVKTGSGDVSLTWGAAPKGDVAAWAGSGNVVLRFPKGTKLASRLVAGSGSAVNSLGESADAALRVSVVTGSGNSVIEAAP